MSPEKNEKNVGTSLLITVLTDDATDDATA